MHFCSNVMGNWLQSCLPCSVFQAADNDRRVFITDHNVHETLSITDRAYLLFEGKVLFQGTAEQLAENEIVREKYLGRDFELRKKNL